MSAWEMPLDPDLQEALMAGVLTLQEAWRMQDEILLQGSPELVTLPQELWMAVQKLELFEADPTGPPQ